MGSNSLSRNVGVRIMKGILPKRIASSNLQCAKCVQFRDDDPDIYYCALDQPEFAGLCENYQYRRATYQDTNEDDGYPD